MMSHAIIAGLAAVSTAALPALSSTCLSDREGQALVMMALPELVVAARSRCMPSLPATASLTQAGQIIAARWHNDAMLVRDEADRAIEKIATVTLTRLVGKDASREMIASIVRNEVAKGLWVGECATADAVIDALSPLPARNVARAMLAVQDTRRTPGTLPFSLCRTKA